MALIACKECGKELSSKAKACPHCGFKPRRTSLFTWIVTIFVALPVLIGIIISAGESSSTSAARTPQEIEAERQRKLDDQRRPYAFMLAERAVKARLKAPSTAKFSSVLDSQVGPLSGGGRNKWAVKRYVDAQNSFGALLRQQYQVVIEFEDGKYDSSRVISADLY